jgi:plastocyanin
VTRRALTGGLLAALLLSGCGQDTDRPAALPTNDAATPAQEVTAEPSSPATKPSAPPVRQAATAAGAPTAAAGAVRTQAPLVPARQGATTTAARPAAPAPRTQPAQQQPSPTSAAKRPSPAASPQPAAQQPGRYTLTISDFAFTPRELTIPVGSTVTVVNRDEAVHDWTSATGVWASGDLRQGESFSFTFRTAGRYDYLCERHPEMTGTITVTPQ